MKATIYQHGVATAWSSNIHVVLQIFMRQRRRGLAVSLRIEHG